MHQPLSVRQLNIYVKSLLEGDARLLSCNVCGEITNFKRHIKSGHLYFTLSDGSAAIKCVMFKGNALRLKFDLKDGLSVVCNGRVSLYEKDGTYQFYVESCTPAGIGDKLIALQLLKEKLAKEGLFDPENKRPLVKYPKRIAVVTSGTGAALQDIINVISRRYPICEILVCSSGVQGSNAAAQMINVLDRIYDISDKIDTIIIGRGGGSSEDLSAFNDEALARKIYDSPIPVVSAVGHQTDTTICDLVSDLRAPTPSAAAELSVPSSEQLLKYIKSQDANIRRCLIQKYELASTKLSAVHSKNLFKNPTKAIEDRAIYVDKSVDKILDRIGFLYDKTTANLFAVVSKIDALSPLKVMARGYSVATKNGETVSSVSQADINDKLVLTVSDGKISCLVTDKE